MLRSTLLTAAAGLALAACGSAAAAVAITPVTGILVRGEALVSGHGCGTGDTQVFKYAASLIHDDGSHLPAVVTVYDASGNATRANAGASYDCFADAAFQNIDATEDQPLLVNVYAFNKKAYEAHADDIEKTISSGSPDQVGTADHPTWVTTCTAKQIADIQVLANCDSLKLVTP